jgi:hypothetical protein
MQKVALRSKIFGSYSSSWIVSRCAVSIWALVALYGGNISAQQPSDGDQEKLEFNRDIRPILSETCFACHGFDAKKREANLRLDTAEGATQDLGGRFAIKPGDLAASELWKRVLSTDPDTVMPPPETKKVLTDAQKEKLKKWIEQGAGYQRHWAFEPITDAPPPADQNAAAWSNHPIDRFIHNALQPRRMKPQDEADRETLIRRVAIALTGLPPKLDELQEFLSDSSPRAYEAMVDRYLDSEQYGEEMAKHWLDVARYADTHGLHLDNERAMWAYRDWVINAFNRNLPFDQFTIEQLAGDLLPSPTQDQIIATGFNRCNVTTAEGGAISEEFLFRYAVDRTSTTIQAWMGLTGGCAVCHDHKFDPLSSKEFYSLYSFFYSAADPAMDGNNNITPPLLRMTSPQRDTEIKQWKLLEADRSAALARWIDEGKYQDPSVAAEKPAAVEVRDIWLDDRFPEGAGVSCSSRNPSVWVGKEELQPAKGLRVLKQVSAVNYEDRIDQPIEPLMLPADGKLNLSVWLDPKSTPEAFMVEMNTTAGVRKLIWGNPQRYGGADEKNSIRVGDIPAGGQWHTIVFDMTRFALPPATQVNQLKLAQYGGLIYWDNIEMVGTMEPATDIRVAMNAWWDSRKGKDTKGADGELNKILKEGREQHTEPEKATLVRKFFLRSISRGANPEHVELLKQWSLAKDQLAYLEDGRSQTFVFADLPKPRDAFVMMRGQYDKPGEAVQPSTPAFLPAMSGIEGRRPNRLDLAKWLLADDHPLTARVTVNRFWQQVFGTGLVKTSYDFGSQGEVPSHPELLDWLSRWYRNNGWNTKSLMRLMLTSKTFKQKTTASPELLAVDPENRYYARGPRLRMDAEQIRDNALFVSGLINLTMGGPGFKTYQPPNIWEPVGYADSNTRFYLQDHGPNLYRRSVYAYFKRTAPPPFMSNFDAPNREQFCTIRERSNTPLQALQLMNDVQHFEAARAFGQRMILEGGDTAEKRIEYAYRLTLSRSPRAEELEVLEKALSHFQERYSKDEAAAMAVVTNGESVASSAVNKTELAAYTLLGNLILNLDETIHRN